MDNNKHYWVGTMNRVMVTTGDNKPIKNWEENKDEWFEVTEQEYKKAYARAWDIAVNSFWHC